MLKGRVDAPIGAVLGRVRTAAASQGWLLSSGGVANAPHEPIVFRKGFGSFKPRGGLEVRLTALDAQRTVVGVTAWRGTVVVDGYDANLMLHALGAQPL